MSTAIGKTNDRVYLEIGQTITLNAAGSDTEKRTFRILEDLGCGGTACVYKVEYEGADSSRYFYVLKEIYPFPPSGALPARRVGTSLDIDSYEDSVPERSGYRVCREQFIKAYDLQRALSQGEDRVTGLTTSAPIGLYEDRASSKTGNYAVYGLFRYIAGTILKKHTEGSLLELVDIQRCVAEVVKAYHDRGFLWFDIKESNVNVVGSGAVLSVNMFDFGSLIQRSALEDFKDGEKPGFVMSFSPTSRELLLPKELESLRTASFGRDPRLAAMSINLLGRYGVRTDIFLLGSMLFKRIFGRAPTQEDCAALQAGSFGMGGSGFMKGCPALASEKLKGILKKCLNYNRREKRYASVQEYLVDLKEVHFELGTNEANVSSARTSGMNVRLCSSEYLKDILMGTGGKFYQLQKLRERFNSRVVLLSEKNRQIMPDNAIDSGDRVFICGDGGMGKSTALYDYMRQTTNPAIYVELCRYRDRDGDFIFDFIFREVCKSFRQTVMSGDSETTEKAKTDLLNSLEQLTSPSGLPEYVLLLDGYNEISKEMRPYFDNELGNILRSWKNVRVIITGRDLPKEDNGGEVEIYKNFRRYRFVGISDEECRELVEDKYPGRAALIQSDRRLWEVLHIPMFMGMFLQLGEENTSAVHTRGEILDRFITVTENAAAKNIAANQTRSAEGSELRRFVVEYSLPFAANEMDVRRSFSLTNAELLKRCRAVWKLLESGGDEPLCEVLDIDLPDISLNDRELGRRIKHIIRTEAGYCYETGDGETAFIHQYYRDYFAARHISNILSFAKELGRNGYSEQEQFSFTRDNGLDHAWSDDACLLLGEMLGDYRNEPGSGL